MDPRSPNVYRTRSWTNRRRALTGLGGVALLLAGYGLGRWQDTPAQVLPAAAAATSAAPSAAAPATTEQATTEPATTEPATTEPATTEPASAPATPAPVPVEYPVLQAEAATELAGAQAQDTEDEGGGQNVGWINRGDHLRFDNLDFGQVAATKARLRLSCGIDLAGRVEIRLDSKENAPVGEVSVSNTGGWQNWRTSIAALTPVTGVHTVFLTFTAPDDTEFVNVNWLQFGR
ncbi:carbohydrate-binding protein [Actinoplanes sp. DH11]|uniref:carbohydrate-binding protein n=1 Tax=Actinoplanes sp. DH11 TaxID=2857011 RepID=UPI001E3ED7F6|nr:carbohydrate-binding protein [Actinoplanes sp. DH11]